MKDKMFVDTNVLVYAHDLDAGDKHEIAIGVVSDLWESGNGVISTQVLQELYVTLTKKVPSHPKKSQVRRILNNYLAWDLAVNNGQTILQASEIEENYNIINLPLPDFSVTRQKKKILGYIQKRKKPRKFHQS